MNQPPLNFPVYRNLVLQYRAAQGDEKSRLRRNISRRLLRRFGHQRRYEPRDALSYNVARQMMNEGSLIPIQNVFDRANAENAAAEAARVAAEAAAAAPVAAAEPVVEEAPAEPAAELAAYVPPVGANIAPAAAANNRLAAPAANNRRAAPAAAAANEVPGVPPRTWRNTMRNTAGAIGAGAAVAGRAAWDLGVAAAPHIRHGAAVAGRAAWNAGVAAAPHIRSGAAALGGLAARTACAAYGTCRNVIRSSFRTRNNRNRNRNGNIARAARGNVRAAAPAPAAAPAEAEAGAQVNRHGMTYAQIMELAEARGEAHRFQPRLRQRNREGGVFASRNIPYPNNTYGFKRGEWFKQ